MPDDFTALTDDITRQVGVERGTNGNTSASFEGVLLDHRRQCLENLRDSGDDFWVNRVKLLDRLAEHKGIPMYDQPNLQWVIDGLREQERQRRSHLRAVQS